MLYLLLIEREGEKEGEMARSFFPRAHMPC
jgi:hypothetical protein